MDQQALEAREKGWLDLLNPRYRWIMLLCTMLPLFQQLSGINTCILYSSEVTLQESLHEFHIHTPYLPLSVLSS